MDVDSDRDLDVVISNDDPDPKLVYLNDGKGHFHVGSSFGRAEWETRNATVADLNGDGQPDIIAANRVSKGAPPNDVCLNRGHGRFDVNCLTFMDSPSQMWMRTDTWTSPWRARKLPMCSTLPALRRPAVDDGCGMRARAFSRPLRRPG